jgi:hypothetical protein
MPGLVPGIHAFHTAQKTLLAGTSPANNQLKCPKQKPGLSAGL